MLKKPLCLDHPGPCYHVPSHRTAAVQVPRRIDQRWSGAVGHGWAWYLGEVLKLEFCVSWEAMDLCDMDLFRKVCLEPEMYRSGVAPKSPNHPQLTSAQCFSGLGLVEVASKPQKKSRKHMEQMGFGFVRNRKLCHDLRIAKSLGVFNRIHFKL